MRKKMEFKKLYYTLAITFLYFFLEITLFRIVKSIGVQKYWVIIPTLIYTVSKLYKKFEEKVLIYDWLIEISNILALLMMYISISNRNIYDLIWNKYSFLSFLTCVFFLAAVIIKQDILKKTNEEKNQKNNYLFNLFYLNTSKTHEIAMLIDNKIMKTIEKEQTSEELLKRSISGSYGKKDVFANEIGYSNEESSKKRVYENFDVKTTKSIMLRKIYETALENSNKKLQEGDLVVFENIELQQRNIDDTIMILNILQDSKFKNQGNEDLEINLNKMMEKMLDDFTIDYTFKYKWKNESEEHYIIQLPYKSSDNFENGYQHNDLQLGKLSLIGIYRGKVNFSEKDSISSKFLDLMKDSFVDENSTDSKNDIMQLSYNEKESNTFPFEFKHNKLRDTISLIDVIAIIQEINIGSKTENE